MLWKNSVKLFVILLKNLQLTKEDSEYQHQYFSRVNPESGYNFSIFNFSERPLAEVLTEKIGYSVCLDNDTRAMTYGEYMKGCVNGEKNILFVNISWELKIAFLTE